MFLGKYPDDVPGLAQLEQKRQAFRETAGLLPQTVFDETRVFQTGQGRIIIGTNYAETLKQSNARMEELQTVYGLNYIRHSNESGHHYFVASLQENGLEYGYSPLCCLNNHPGYRSRRLDHRLRRCTRKHPYPN
jgi:hypothetical protein